MVVRNKLYRIIEKYRKSLEVNQLKYAFGKNRGSLTRGNKTKNKVLDFFLKNNRWPSRLSKNKKEVRLATRFENFISKESGSYDKNLRRIVMATGRKSNHKRKHNIEGFKKEILEFLEKNGRVPSSNSKNPNIKNEVRLRHKLDYYTLDKNDTTFLSKIYGKDPCHRSGIPIKFRKIINESLDVDKPLIRLVKS